MLTGEASYGPGNNVDLTFNACGNADGTLWLLQVRSVSDDLEGFRDLADEDDEDDEDEGDHISVDESVVAAVQVPPGTDESAAVRRLLKVWERRGDDRQIELISDVGVFELALD